MNLLMYDNICICVYIILWLITFIVYQKKQQSINAGSVILLSFLVYAIATLLAFNGGMRKSMFLELKLFPFLYLFSMLYLVALPVLKFCKRKYSSIEKPSNIILYVFVVVFTIASLSQIPNIFSNSIEGISRIIIANEGAEIYSDTMKDADQMGNWVVSNLAILILNIFMPIIVLLFFYSLTLTHNYIIVKLGLGFSCLILFFDSITSGLRGMVVEDIYLFVITYFLFKEHLSEKVNRWVKRVGMVVGIFVITLISAITLSRFSDRSYTALESVYYYAGHANITFNNYAFDNNGLRYGDRTFPLFKRILGFNNVPKNFMERRWKYPQLKVNDEIFCTHIGDFCFDIGPIMSVVFFLVTTFIMLRLTRNVSDKIFIHQLILIQFLAYLSLLGGIKLYTYADTGGNLKLIATFLAYIIFKFDFNNNVKSNKY